MKMKLLFVANKKTVKYIIFLENTFMQVYVLSKYTCDQLVVRLLARPS